MNEFKGMMMDFIIFIMYETRKHKDTIIAMLIGVLIGKIFQESTVIGELNEVMDEIRVEIGKTRKENKNYSDSRYAENTMYIAGLYKAMSIMSKKIRSELDALDRWADAESKQLKD